MAMVARVRADEETKNGYAMRVINRSGTRGWRREEPVANCKSGWVGVCGVPSRAMSWLYRLAVARVFIMGCCI
jgi:hypothetical protein